MQLSRPWSVKNQRHTLIRNQIVLVWKLILFFLIHAKHEVVYLVINHKPYSLCLLRIISSQPTFQRRINVFSTLWTNVEITLIRRWKWNKNRRRIFNFAQRWYVGVRRWNNVETKLIQLYLNFVPTWPQH